MIITSNMNLAQLAERMGDTATEQEARVMRDLLCEAGHEGRDTSEIAESEWFQHLGRAVEMMRAEVLEVHVLNAEGASLLAVWVRSIAKNPADQNMEAWATEAEDVANNAGPDESIIIEMRGFMTASGRPETLTLPRTAFDLAK